MEGIGFVSARRGVCYDERSLINHEIPRTDFTNVLKKSQIERLAEADEHELVREVQVRRTPTSLRLRR